LLLPGLVIVLVTAFLFVFGRKYLLKSPKALPG